LGNESAWGSATIQKLVEDGKEISRIADEDILDKEELMFLKPNERGATRGWCEEEANKHKPWCNWYLDSMKRRQEHPECYPLRPDLGLLAHCR
jgi:hypothetical protein